MVLLGVALCLAWALNGGRAEPEVGFPSSLLRVDAFGLDLHVGSLPAPIGMRTDYSGCTYDAASGQLLVVNRVSGGYRILYFDLDGDYLRNVTLQGFDDVEGIAIFDPVSHRVAIVEEGLNEITVLTVTSNTTSISKSSGLTFAMGLGDLFNVGIEGITWDAAGSRFFAVKEKSPMAVYRVDIAGTNAVTTEPFDAGAVFGGVVTDLSDVFYDRPTDTLLILSDEGDRVLQCDLAGNIVAQLPLGMNQAEGLVLTDARDQLLVIGEPNEYKRFVPAVGCETVEGETMVFTVLLSEPTAPGVTGRVDFAVTSSISTPGIDFNPTNGAVLFPPGVTSAVIEIATTIDDELEGPELVRVTLTDPMGLALGDAFSAPCTILDEGGFAWDTMPDRVDVGRPFPVTVTARSPSNAVLTGFTGRASLSATIFGTAERDFMQGQSVTEHNVPPFYPEITRGLVFSPTTAITVTHLTMYRATKVSLWTDAGVLLATTNAPLTSGWHTVELATPVALAAGATYRLGSPYQPSANYGIGKTGVPRSFSDGTISSGCSASGDKFPSRLEATEYAVDLRYRVGDRVPAPMSPAEAGPFVNGVWNGWVRVEQEGEEARLLAQDDFGHMGESAAFDVTNLPDIVMSVPAVVTEGDGLLAGAGAVAIAAPWDDPVEPLTIQLASGDTNRLGVAATVQIAFGETNAVFGLEVVDNALLQGPVWVNLYAYTPDFGSGTGQVEVLDDEVTAVSVQLPASRVEGGPGANGSVRFADPPVRDVPISLLSSDTSEAVVSSMASMPAGATTVNFALSFPDDELLDGTQWVTIQATVAGWPAGSNMLAVLDNESTNLSVSVPAVALEGDGVLSAVGMVAIAGLLTNDLLVTLTSHAVGEVTVPPSAVITQGQFSATFDLSIQDDAVSDGPRDVVIEAEADGFGPGRAVIRVEDNEPLSGPILLISRLDRSSLGFARLPDVVFEESP